MADDDIKKLEARLTRLEAALAQQPGGTGGTAPPGGAVVDPAPWPGGGWGGFARWPHPVVDPAAFAASSFAHPRPVVDPAAFAPVSWGFPRWPTPVVDPAPWPTTVVDPAPWAAGGVQQSRQAFAASTLGRIGPIGDPPPIDVSRFSISQLEASLHSLHAEKARLTSMETMINQQLEKLKKQG